MPVVLVDLHRDLDAVAVERRRADGAHLDAGDPHRSPRLQPGDVVESRFQPVLLPREAALAAQQKDQDECHDDCEDGDDADLQLGPGKRTCPWHSLSYERNSLMYSSCDARSSAAFPSNAMTPSRSMMNSASSHFAASARRMRTSVPCFTASCSATKNASRSWWVTMIEVTSSRSRSLTISSSMVVAVIGSSPVVASS